MVCNRCAASPSRSGDPDPSLAVAQGTLTGTVRDASGGVLPDVTVEASSSALTEKVRTVVTDSSGQYRIIELNPGTYSLSFSLRTRSR